MKTTIFNTSFLVLLFFPFLMNGQNVSITGYVSDEKTGNNLENVNIYESGSVIGTITDKNGFYKLILPIGEIKLSAKLQGFHDFSNNIEIKSDTVFTICLKPKSVKKSIEKKESNIQASINEKDLKKNPQKF